MSAEGPAAPRGRRDDDLWRGLMGVRRVLIANFLREARARLGEGRFAYIRVLVMHMAAIGVFYVMRSVLGAHSPLQTDLFTALAAGFFPYLLFSTALSGAASALDSNRALLFYPGVRPLDFVFSAMVVEGLAITTTFAVLLTANYQFSPVPQIHDPLELVTALAAAWLLGAGVGLTQMGVQGVAPLTKILFQLLLKPMMFVSGVMYAGSELPQAVIEILWWNPLFHLTEMTREGLSASYRSPIYAPVYVGLWVSGVWAAGLAMERHLRRNLRS